MAIRRSGRIAQSEVEILSVGILKSQAERIRQTGGDPEKIAADYLNSLHTDGRVTDIDLDRTSIGWLPEVYHAIVKHVGRGGVSHYIRESFYLDMVSQGYVLDSIPVIREGHINGAAKRKKASIPDQQPGRQSVVIPLVIPTQWKEFGEKAFPGEFGTVIKASTQKRLEKDTGMRLPVQRRLGKWLGRDE